jgi:hypothetical protein
MSKQLSRILLLAILAMASGATSVTGEEEADRLDARLLGYPEKYWQAPPGTAGAWAVLAVLGLVCLGPLFINSKRTHLD